MIQEMMEDTMDMMDDDEEMDEDVQTEVDKVLFDITQGSLNIIVHVYRCRILHNISLKIYYPLDINQGKQCVLLPSNHDILVFSQHF